MAVEVATASTRNFRYPSGSLAKGPSVKREPFFFIGTFYHEKASSAMGERVGGANGGGPLVRPPPGEDRF